MTTASAPAPRTNSELRYGLVLPVEALPRTSIDTPGCIYDATLRTHDEVAVLTIRLAIAFGMPPQELSGHTDVPDPELLQVIGMSAQWWDSAHGIWRLNDADLNEALTEAELVALDWLNGMGLTDADADTGNPLTRCHPALAATHAYVHDADGLYLMSHAEISESGY